MTAAFDPRIVRVGIEIQGEIIFFEDLDIRISGNKFDGPTSNSCTIKISNLTRDQRNYILTKATPYAMRDKTRNNPVYVTVDVGRESYGTFRLFEGSVFSSNVTPPPDIGITLNCLTQNPFLGLITENNSFPALTDLRTIAQSVADRNGLTLDYKVKTSKQIANSQINGSLTNQVQRLQMLGGIKCSVDNKVLVVKDLYETRNAKNFILSMNTGMVGVPQATMQGVTAQMLVDPNLQIGDGITIDSKINPAVNGEDYIVQQIKFDIANRDNPFFYTLLCSNLNYYQGST